MRYDSGPGTQVPGPTASSLWIDRWSAVRNSGVIRLMQRSELLTYFACLRSNAFGGRSGGTEGRLILL